MEESPFVAEDMSIACDEDIGITSVGVAQIKFPLLVVQN